METRESWSLIFHTQMILDAIWVYIIWRYTGNYNFDTKYIYIDLPVIADHNSILTVDSLTAFRT